MFEFLFFDFEKIVLVFGKMKTEISAGIHFSNYFIVTKKEKKTLKKKRNLQKKERKKRTRSSAHMGAWASAFVKKGKIQEKTENAKNGKIRKMHEKNHKIKKRPPSPRDGTNN